MGVSQGQWFSARVNFVPQGTFDNVNTFGHHRWPGPEGVFWHQTGRDQGCLMPVMYRAPSTPNHPVPILTEPMLTNPSITSSCRFPLVGAKFSSHLAISLKLCSCAYTDPPRRNCSIPSLSNVCRWDKCNGKSISHSTQTTSWWWLLYLYSFRRKKLKTEK